MNELNITSANRNERLRCLFSASNVTQRDAARILGISASTLSLKINGKIRFSADEIAELADLFGVSADVLLGRTPLVVS